MDPVSREAAESEAGRLQGFFRSQGAELFNTEILQPADILLDLYGEDIRSRSYVTADSVQGELMLRPDFTVPLVKFHMERHAAAAAYTYCGPVFRKQWPGSDRARENLQVGYEVFGGADSAAADAGLYSIFHNALSGLDLTSATGDLGILIAAIDGLRTDAGRKEALKRHLWRPERFRSLLEQFSSQTATARWPKIDPDDLEDRIRDAGPVIGTRSIAEVAARIRRIAEDEHLPPISAEEIAAIEDILLLKGRSEDVLVRLRGIADRHGHIGSAVDRFEARLDELAKRGIEAAGLWFEASYGRTSLEYYDGFVFGFFRSGDELPVALGGRYDMLTRELGDGRWCPAVGGVVRPELTASLAKAGAGC
ncbi:MAG: ATP phosphoribosyltransferase regulatory subunit [Rhodobacteraceae bacterium]|nr:ATP phosphoribosyltransferase regulatory subunit [Paracoccaceae bacterium]